MTVVSSLTLSKLQSKHIACSYSFSHRETCWHWFLGSGLTNMHWAWQIRRLPQMSSWQIFLRARHMFLLCHLRLLDLHGLVLWHISRNNQLTVVIATICPSKHFSRLHHCLLYPCRLCFWHSYKWSVRLHISSVAFNYIFWLFHYLTLPKACFLRMQKLELIRCNSILPVH